MWKSYDKFLFFFSFECLRNYKEFYSIIDSHLPNESIQVIQEHIQGIFYQISITCNVYDHVQYMRFFFPNVRLKMLL